MCGCVVVGGSANLFFSSTCWCVVARGKFYVFVFVFVCGGKKALDQVKWVAGSRSNSGGISLASGFGSTG